MSQRSSGNILLGNTFHPRFIDSYKNFTYNPPRLESFFLLLVFPLDKPIEARFYKIKKEVRPRFKWYRSMKGRVEHWFSGYVRWLILHKVRACDRIRTRKVLFSTSPRFSNNPEIEIREKVSRSGTKFRTSETFYRFRFASRFARGDPLVKESYRDGLVSLSLNRFSTHRSYESSWYQRISRKLSILERTSLWITTRDTPVLHRYSYFSWNEGSEGNILLIGKKKWILGKVVEIFFFVK